MAAPITVHYLATGVPPAMPLPRPDATVVPLRTTAAVYLDLYRKIGGPWGWDKRLSMPEAGLAAYLAAPSTLVFGLEVAGTTAGVCEFDAAAGAEVELCNFGLLTEHQGRGLGPHLLQTALATLWQQAPRRVWLHTDEWDHPAALATYLRAGFVVTAVQVEDPTDL